MFNPLDFIFKKRITSVVGIDIGTASIKMAELHREEENRYRLLNYATMEMRSVEEENFRGLSFNLQDADIAKKIKLLRKEAGITSDTVILSLPVFSTFVTVMDMPLLEEKELASAVPLQAREYIPIPINEVVLDWKVVRTIKKSDLLRTDPAAPAQAQSQPATPPAEGAPKKKDVRTEVLLMAAPREMVQKYVRIAQMAELTILGLEIESFALARAGVTESATPVLLLDIGAYSSSIAVFDEGFLRVVHTVGISSQDLTRACARAMGTTVERAAAFKESFGLYSSDGETEIVTAYLPLLEAMARDIERVVSAYWRVSSRQVGSVVISGKSALLKGLDKYLASRLRIPVNVINPFSRVMVPKDLVPVSGSIGAELANAVGLAMKEI